MDEELLRENHELFRLIQNDTRKQLLSYIYQEPRSYTDLMEFSQLKPGSLYHHLNVMKSLVEKIDHGLYSVTHQGEDVIESLGIVKETKPSVSNSDESKIPEVSEEVVGTQGLEVSRSENINQLLWLGSINYIVLSVILVTMFALSLFDVALAGTALYASPNPLVFDLFALVTGLFVLFLYERLTLTYSNERHLFHAFVIRVVGILPATVVGITTLLLFTSGITISPGIWPFLFAITVFFGYMIMALGLQFLRAFDRETSYQVALLPTAVDLLIGMTILFSGS